MKTNKLIKNMTAFTTKSGAQPVLQTLNFNEDGNVYATDSIIGVCLIGHNPTCAELNLNPKTLETCTDKYPNLGRLLGAASDTSTVLTLSDIKALLSEVKAHKKDQLIALVFKDTKLRVGELVLDTSVVASLEVNFNVKKLLTVLQFISDTAVPTVTMDLSFKRFRPVWIEAEGAFKIIAMPVRIN